MGSITSSRVIAEAILRTLQRLEADPSVDACDPAFIQLKCTLIHRMLRLQGNAAEFESSIRLPETHTLKPVDSFQHAMVGADPCNEENTKPVVVIRLKKGA